MMYIAPPPSGKMLTRIFPALLLFLAFTACSRKAEPTISEDFNVSGIILPEYLEHYAGETVELQILGKHGPAATDAVEFVGGQTCRMPITSVEAKRFTFTLDPSLFSGNYRVHIVRGDRSRDIGWTQLVVHNGIDIDPQGCNVYGQVASQGKGLSGVVVSDGIEVTRTDENGIYRLQSQKKHGYVFVSVPSGYEPLTDGVLPRIHRQLTASKETAERADFSLVPAEGQDNSTILVMGDIHLARRTEDRKQFKDFIDDVNAYLPTRAGRRIYGLTLGDLAWNTYWKVNTYGFAEYLQDINNIKGLTIWQTVGNHDHSIYYPGDFDTVREFKSLIAPTYYSFNIGQVHCIVMDDIDCTKQQTAEKDSKGNACYKHEYDNRLVSEIVAWLAKDLQYVDKGTPLLIAMHAQLHGDDGNRHYWYDQSSYTELMALLKTYDQVQLFTGHSHVMYNVDKLSTDHIFEHNAGAVCGTWWWSGYETPGVNIGKDGAPGGYTILDIDGKEFKWQYKGTGFPTDFQFRTYDRNCIHLTADTYTVSATDDNKKVFDSYTSIWKEASSDNEVYINIWNWDPSWTVEVTEEGGALTVERRTAGESDPLHLIAYTAKRLNKNASLSFPTDANKHLFKVRASSATSTLVIKVTDRFGRVYTETMERPKVFDTESYSVNSFKR